MADNLFEGLPPPSHQPENQHDEEDSITSTTTKKVIVEEPPPVPAAVPKPILKSALKRPKPPVEETNPDPDDGGIEKAPASGKRLRFKTTTDASEMQVIEAMKKIALHIKAPTKFSKASKLAIQLIQAGSVKPGTSDHFFAVLEAAMSLNTACTDPSVRADYHALFSAAEDAAEFLDRKQKNKLTTWTIRAVVANDLLTDDSFLFSKTARRVKDAITGLPVATKDDDIEEAAALNNEAGKVDEHSKREEAQSADEAKENKKDDSDPFGLDALIPSMMKKDERAKGMKDTAAKVRKEVEEEENKRFLKSQREALITCLEIAARRYKTPWCQTVIDILVKHAFDNVAKFTSCQRDAIGKLWTSIREQQTRRKQGKSVNGKLDVNGFEWLQQKYAGEKISIRHAVGGSGDRRATQWLG